MKNKTYTLQGIGMSKNQQKPEINKINTQIRKQIKNTFRN